MTTRNARVRFAGCGVVVASLAVTNAFAAATWTIKPGGSTTASATNPGFKDITTGSTFACASATFSGFQGSNVPVPPDVAAALAARAAPRLEPLPS